MSVVKIEVPVKPAIKAVITLWSTKYPTNPPTIAPPSEPRMILPSVILGSVKTLSWVMSFIKAPASPAPKRYRNVSGICFVFWSLLLNWLSFFNYTRFFYTLYTSYPQFIHTFVLFFNRFIEPFFAQKSFFGKVRSHLYFIIITFCFLRASPPYYTSKKSVVGAHVHSALPVYSPRASKHSHQKLKTRLVKKPCRQIPCWASLCSLKSQFGCYLPTT